MNLSINSTLQEIEKAHETLNLKQLAKAISIGENRLRRILTATGYEFDSGLKKWRYTKLDGGEIVRMKSLYAVIQELQNSTTGTPSTTGAENDGTTDTTGNTEQGTTGTTVTPSTTGTTAILTQEEILILKEMAKAYKAPAAEPSSNDLLGAIEGLQDGKTNKRTFAMNADVLSELDAFCELNRIRKSDFITLAVQDALHKYK